MLTAYGSIDILVNNAAVDAGSKLTDISLDEWDRVLCVNLTG